ncbi:outer membrane protein [Neorhizobium petrolearium]|uniref:outer membrane protein n=1 Tax=Neorhizobium petrolearium TaxID=515361 RepID=UPI003F17CA34
MRTLLYTTVAVFALTGIAAAADAVDQVPTAPVAEEAITTFTWAGPYVGIHGGYGWADGEFSNGALTDSTSFDGGRIGAFVGYNWQFSNGFVAGIEGDVNYDWNDKAYGGADNVGTDFSGSVRGRVGYAVDRVLVFAAGGWTATNAFVENPDDNETAHGWTIGGGVDWAVTDNLFLRAEYRYNDFQSVDLSGVDSDFDQHVINVGLGVKF